VQKDSKLWNRRVSRVAERPGEGRLTQPTAAFQPSQAEPLFTPKAATRRTANRQREGLTIEPQKFMISATRSWSLTMTRFMFLVLERHRVVAPTSARPLAAPVPAL